MAVLDQCKFLKTKFCIEPIKNSYWGLLGCILGREVKSVYDNIWINAGWLLVTKLKASHSDICVYEEQMAKIESPVFIV